MNLLLDFVAHFARTTPTKLAVQDLATGRGLTYAELDDAIDRAAHVLRNLVGESQGERVAVLSRNSAEMLVLHFGCVRAGAIFVPLNWRLSNSEIAFMIGDCEPAVILVHPEFTSLIDDASIPRVLLDASARGFAARMAAAPAPPAPAQGTAVAPDTPITLLYSSGTTGKSKGVIVTQLNAWRI
jgi:fatty-acyl-CoA synthase